MKETLDLQTSQKTVRAVTGTSILADELRRYTDTTGRTEAVAFVDANVWSHHQAAIDEAIAVSGLSCRYITVPEGESSKTVAFWEQCQTDLLAHHIRRDTTIIAIGGGVTGDLAGFVAATVLRGVPLLHVPTTVLAMVDSAIGGKTGINHPMGKNLIGAFYQPEAIIADLRFLDTLPPREWANGLSEILKYGYIADAALFSQCELFLDKTPSATHPDRLMALIRRCIEIKADIVQRDEFEGGVRAFLNFGHTFAHALEKNLHFDTISHGEAVYIGMHCALHMSNKTASEPIPDHLHPFRSLYSFRIREEDVKTEELIEAMRSDKKNRAEEGFRFVLLKKLQHPYLKTVTDKSLIAESLADGLDQL
ncbi:MAG: 3-dehydroquinate synthase [Balneolaceae bacterium]